MAQINLAVHGLQGSIRAGNEAITYYKDPHELRGKCDFVMANPPFNVDEVDAEAVKTDKRLPFGLPGVNKAKKVTNANYLWLQYFYSYLNENGRAGVVMSSQASSAGRDEALVRRKLVETGAVDVMIDVRGNFFYTRTVPCQLWFYDRSKEQDAERADHVLMLDARTVFRKVSRSLVDFSPEQQKNLAGMVWLYRGQGERFLRLVESYLQQAVTFGQQAREPLEVFASASGKLLALMRPFATEGHYAEGLASSWQELLTTQVTVAADSGAVLTEVETQAASWVVATEELSSRSNAELHKIRKALHPLAGKCRDLTRLVDLLVRLAGRVAEPLFLGRPANHAAKHAAKPSSGMAEGIYLTPEARAAIGLKKVDDTKKTALTAEEVKTSQEKAKLTVTKENIIKQWQEYEKDHKIGEFRYSRQTPPLRDMEILDLTPKNSKRQDATSIYADIDGFTQYVSDHIEDNTEDVVRTLHVIRAELERVLTCDFGGRRIRFIGDCIHGLLCEGNSQSTENEKTISATVLLAGAFRSSFDQAIRELKQEKIETGSLGLAIGFDFGPMTATRLGLRGDRVRCSVSRGVLLAEEEQCRCDGEQTAIGQKAYDEGSDAVRRCFGSDRSKSRLNYNEAVEALAEKGDKTADSARSVVSNIAATVGSTSYPIVRPFASR